METAAVRRTNRVVVIGASAGGVESLRQVASALHHGLPAAIFVVLHIPPSRPSCLPQILSRAGELRAFHPKDGDRIEPGAIYVAPPDHHLLIEGDRVGVKRGPKENRFRPSIDALFRSAAYNYGANVIGVVLSGALDDGTSGLWTIKRLGGTAIVQEPNEARFESMPLSALDQVNVDYVVEAGDIGSLLTRLVGEDRSAPEDDGDPILRKRVKTELAIASEGGAFEKGIMDVGELTPFTCPECHGALVKLMEGKMTRYRCHTGHGYSDSALLEGVMESTGEQLWQVMRSLEEAVMLIQHMSKDAEHAGNTHRAGALLVTAKDLEARAKSFHASVLNHESLSGDNIESKAL